MYVISDGGINNNTLDTIESVMLTKNIKNIDGVKVDVRKTLDNIFVISKYEELNKFTYGNGKISECNYDYLRKVKFPSHIFKYYIPTLEEILKRYNPEKIIVLEIYEINELNKLFELLINYNYKYYFMSKDMNILNELKKLEFNKIGIIINYDNVIENTNTCENIFFIEEDISTK